VITNRQPRTFQVTRSLADGRKGIFAIVGFPLLDERGEVASVGAIGIDVTRETQAEQALRENEERLRLVMESTGEGIYAVDLEGRCTLCNRAAARILGYDDPDDLLGRDIHTMVHHSHADGRPYPLAECRAHQAIASKASIYVDDEVFWRRDGRPIPVAFRSNPVERNGEVVGTAVSFSDISERKRAAEAQKDSEERYRNLIDNMEDGVFLVEDGALVFANRVLASRLGYSVEEMIGRPYPDFLMPDNRATSMNLYRRLVGGEALQSRYEVNLLHKDGRSGVSVLLILARIPRSAGTVAVLGTARDVSEYKRTEEALYESEEQFRALLDNSPQSLNLKDAKGRYLLVNPEWERQHAVSAQAALGRTSYQVFGEETGERLAGREREVIATGETQTFEATVQLPDGRYRTRLITKFPVRDQSGTITRIGTVGIDITERKRLEREILENEARFREFAESSSDWLWETDSESRVTFVSDRITHLLGVDPANIVGRKRQEFAAFGQDPILRKLRDTIQARRPIRDFCYEIQDNQGRRRWLSISGKPRHSATGEFLGYRGTGTDITEKTQALHREAQVRERFLAAIETVPVSVVLFDEEDRLVVANERYRVRLNVAAKLRPGISFEEILRAEVKAGAIVEAQEDEETWIRERMARHRNPTGSFEIQRSNGWFQLHEHRTTDGYTIVVVDDITDRKKAEQGLLAARDELEARVSERTRALEQEIIERQYAEHALQEANQDLEKRVDERTRHLSDEIAERKKLEAQFVQAQKMEAIGQLAGGIAHDFNNLLTVIQGNLSWLKDRMLPGDDKASQLMTMALEAARRAGDLTHRMLAFSRRQDLRPERIDLPHVLESITPLVTRALSESITFEVKLAADIWPLMADPHQLESAILNIAINARDAMPTGGTFTLRGENRLVDASRASRHNNVEPGKYVCLSMTDSGAGMPPEVLARVFDPFFTTKDVGKGSGLGLSMVFGFTRQSGGFVEIASKSGKGTTVDLYLPRCQHGAVSTSATATSAKTREVSTADLVVLVVEDDALVRGVTLEYLKMAGFKALQADEGQTAVKMMETTAPIDVVLSDIIMPGGMSGLELGEIVRKRWPETAVVFMSGYSYDEFSRRGINPDAIGLLRKPFTKHELLQKIADTVSARPATH